MSSKAFLKELNKTSKTFLSNKYLAFVWSKTFLIASTNDAIDLFWIMSFTNSLLIDPNAIGSENEFLNFGSAYAQPFLPISPLIVSSFLTK